MGVIHPVTKGLSMRLAIAPIFLFLPMVLRAADPQTLADSLATIREQALKDATAYELVESMTTEVGPRMAGTAGDAKGVAWAQAKFKELGFDEVRLEPVSYPVWERGAESLLMISPFQHELHIDALGGSVATPKAGVQADVVEFADLKALQAAAADQVRGKIVFINYRMEPTRDGSSYGPAVAARVVGASAAAKLGAKALLIRSVGTDHRSRAPHTGTMRYEDNINKIPAAALGNADADILANAIKRGKPVRLNLQLQNSLRKKEYQGYNVIGEIKGREFPKQVIAIGGHLDSWDMGTGAIDDASGCAITMAAAALIGKLPQAPKRTVRVVLFANEEQGIYGGKAYAAARAAAGEVKDHIIAAESDFGAGKIYQLDVELPASERVGLETLYAALAPIGVSVGKFTASGSADFGPMKTLGAPVADLRQDGTDYFDYHHTPEDTLDKIDPDALAQNVAAYAAFALYFADR
jgi:carboxypeptidase Q